VHGPSGVGLVVGEGRLAADALATGLGCLTCRCGPLLDQLALHLRERLENRRRETARWCPEVQALAQALEVDPALSKLLDQPDAVGQGPRQPVERDHDDGVAGPGVLEQLREAGAVVPGTGQHVRVDVLRLNAGGGESVELAVG
jgi:hypothetical protein